MHLEILAVPTQKLLKKFELEKWLKSYYLAGGTALALQYGHRESIDLDFFSEKKINTGLLIKKLSTIGKFKLINEEENTVEGILDGVKVSFMSYPYMLVVPKEKFFTNIFLAGVLDIALMKLNAVAGRNTKKDFIDLYFFLQKENKDLSWLFRQMKKKYIEFDLNTMHLLKALVYFVEADKEPIPIVLEKVNWPAIKKYFIREVKKISCQI